MKNEKSDYTVKLEKIILGIMGKVTSESELGRYIREKLPGGIPQPDEGNL